MSEAGSNRLAMLAAEIRAAHSGVGAAAVVRANHALDAGRALIEAKSMLKHGRWLPWLREHCGLPERTAQLYMKLADLGVLPEVVAVLGMEEASRTEPVQHMGAAHDYFADYDEAAQRQWILFAQFVRSWDHVEWLMRQGWLSPDAWLADTDYRKCYRMREPSDAFLQAWDAHKQKHAFTPRAQIEGMLTDALAA
jgi:Protein of unknown function (DUF3102)